MRMRAMCIVVITACFFIPALASAHMPVLVGSTTPGVITDPERSYAFYDTLRGESRTYHIAHDVSWVLYLNLLVPQSANPNAKYDAMVVNERTGAIVASLEGRGVEWTPYFEQFGADNYLRGPELRKEMDAGEYAIVITGEGNTGAYAMALGERESFTLREVAETVALIPHLKREFFRVSPASFIASPLGGGYAVLFMCIGFFLAYFIRRFLRKKLTGFAELSLYSKNIGTHDRMMRAVFGLILFMLGILTTWHPVLFIAAGFCIYQAVGTWCLVYSLLGKNTCPT